MSMEMEGAPFLGVDVRVLSTLSVACSALRRPLKCMVYGREETH